VPCFPWPERTARAVGVAVRCGHAGRPGVRARLAARSETAPGPARRRGHRPPPGELAGPLRLAVPPAGGLLAPDAARDLLASAGLPVIETALCGDAEAAAAASRPPRVSGRAQGRSSDLTHKERRGWRAAGDCSRRDAVRSAAADLPRAGGRRGRARANPTARESNCLSAASVIRNSAPWVMAGAGWRPGGDAARCPARASRRWNEAEATALLRSLRGAAVLGGLAGQRPGGRRGRCGCDRHRR